MRALKFFFILNPALRASLQKGLPSQNASIAGTHDQFTGWRAYLVAIVLVAVAVGLRFAFDPWLGNDQPFIMLYGAVAATAWLGGWEAGTLATIAGYLAFNYFFIPPRNEFVFDTPAVASAIAAALSCLIIILFAEENRRARILAAFRQSEAANHLARSAHLASIVESSTDAIMAIDLRGVITSWNRGAEHLYGYSAQEIVGKPVELLIPSDRAAEEEKILAQIRGGMLVEHYETARRRKDGGIVPVALNVSPLRDPFGEIIGASKIARDITRRKMAEEALQRSEEALRESEARFRQLADSMPQLVWTADSDGRVDYYNERIHSFFGASRDSSGKWTWEPMLHPDDVEATIRAWREATGTGHPYSMTHRAHMADGSYRWHLSRAVPVRNARGQVVKWFGTATDIDDQKRAEERLEAVVAQRTAKLRETVHELEGFSYSIAHDMRAPLRSMSGYASILRTDYSQKLDADALNFLRRIESSAERLDRLIQDVLDYSKIVRSEMDLEPVDFGALAEDIILSYSHLQEPHATIILQPPLPMVQANQAALTQVLSNLLGNAVKFVRPGTKPRVVVRSEPVQDSFVRIWIEDNGIGIEPEAQQRIFQIFQRLHRPEQYEGTGIGLSIVRKAAERMGGRVGLESTPGKGSRFWVELMKA